MEDIKSKKEVPAEESKSETRRHRGELGPHNLKGLYHSFRRKEGRKARHISLKSFAHTVAENGTDEEKTIALTWFKNKAEQKRHRR